MRIRCLCPPPTALLMTRPVCGERPPLRRRAMVRSRIGLPWYRWGWKGRTRWRRPWGQRVRRGRGRRRCGTHGNAREAGASEALHDRLVGLLGRRRAVVHVVGRVARRLSRVAREAGRRGEARRQREARRRGRGAERPAGGAREHGGRVGRCRCLRLAWSIATSTHRNWPAPKSGFAPANTFTRCNGN